jgi:hypothetical protein
LPGVSLHHWRRVGAQIHRITDSSCWWLGDWLVYGEKNYPGRYREAIAQTELDYQTLRNYAWVARAFEMSRRRDALSFQHHAEVAALPETQQDLWLTRAVTFGWSRRKLREAMKAEREAAKAGTREATIDLQVNVAASRYQRWLEAARTADLSLTTWIATILDEAAGSALSGDAPDGGHNDPGTRYQGG